MTKNFTKLMYDRRLEKGLCSYCGKPKDREGRYCFECLEKKNNRVKADRHFASSQGICPRCQKNKLYGDEKTCLECKLKNTEYKEKARKANREAYNEYLRIYQKSRYQQLKESGLCPRCGKRKPTNGLSICGICRDRNNRNRNDRKILLPEKYKKPGICIWCNNPIKENYKVCEYHYQLNMQKLEDEKSIIERKKMKAEIHKKIINRMEENGEKYTK